MNPIDQYRKELLHGAVALMVLAYAAPALAVAARWSLMTGLQRQDSAKRAQLQFPQIPVYYCSNLTKLGTLTDEAVQANLQGALNEWFHSAGDIRPYLAGIDAAACANGVATTGTILIQQGVDSAGSGKLFKVATTTAAETAGGVTETEITSATITIYSSETVCKPFCGSVPYAYLGSGGTAGYDLWSVALTAVGEAIGLQAGNDVQSVVNETITYAPRRHLLLHDFSNLQALYSQTSPPWNSGFAVATTPGDPGVRSIRQYRFAFHETALGNSSTILPRSAPFEPYGATEVAMDQPAACYLSAPLNPSGSKFLVALSAADVTVPVFNGNKIIVYNTDGSSNASFRTIVPPLPAGGPLPVLPHQSNSLRAPAVGCSPKAYALSWVDQSDQSINIWWSADGKTWGASTLRGAMKSFVTPALAFEPVSARFLLLYADANANGALMVSVSTDATAKTFLAPVAIVEPAKAGTPPPAATEFIPGLACHPTSGKCLAGWGPGALANFAFDDAATDFALADLKVAADGSFTVTDFSWPSVRGWGLSIGANANTFVIAATDVPGQGLNFVATTAAGAARTVTPGGNGSQGAALNVVWADLYNSWFFWGTGSYLFGN